MQWLVSGRGSDSAGSCSSPPGPAARGVPDLHAVLRHASPRCPKHTAAFGGWYVAGQILQGDRAKARPYLAYLPRSRLNRPTFSPVRGEILCRWQRCNVVLCLLQPPQLEKLHQRWLTQTGVPRRKGGEPDGKANCAEAALVPGCRKISSLDREVFTARQYPSY